MRLTLRTLLAHLDDILNEDESQELQKKIDDSEVATRLVHQIRQLVGQTRFDVPDVDATGIGADANSVAEYLDSTLSPEQFPEFERVCLDSDMHLSEVAACHQILTLVLGEPAEVTPELKAKIYQLADAASSRAAAANPRELPPSPPAEATPTTNTKTVELLARDEDEHWTEAPDYLKRARRSKWKPIGITALIVFCLTLAGIAGMGSFDRTHPLARFFFGDTVVAETPEEESPDSQPSQEETPQPRASNSQTADRSVPDTNRTERTPAVPETIPNDESQDILQPQNDDSDVDQTEPVDSDDPSPDEDAAFRIALDEALGHDVSDDDAQPAELPAADLAGSEPANDATSRGDDAVAAPADRTGTDASELANIGDEPLVDSPLPNIDPASNDDDLVNLDPPPPPRADPGAAVADAPSTIISVLPTSNDEGEGGDAPAVPDETDGPKTVGRFLSEGQLLIRYNPLSQLWEDVDVREPVRVDEQLLSLPIFRPQLMLATGMQLTMIGPTQTRLRGSFEAPRLQLKFGRVNVETFTQNGTAIGLDFGGTSALADLGDMNSSFSIEVERVHAPGVDPRRQDPHAIVRVFVTSGQLEWRVEGGDPVTLTAGQQMTILDQGAPRVMDTQALPKWIDGRDARPRDPFAMRGLLPNITADRPVSLALREQADSKRQEVRSLAVCSLAYLGEYDPLLVAMNDDRLKSYWTDQYKTLSRNVSLGRDSAELVQQAIAARHGDQGQPFFRMLWGYSPDQLAEDGARTLVELLDHPSSDFRIAAIENLKSITGTPSLYMPHYTEKLRRASVFKWRDKWEKGQIVYREPPEISRLLTAEPAEP